MNLGQMRTLVLSWMDDPQGTYFTPAQVDVFLNNAQKTVQKMLIRAGENYYVVRMQGQLIANEDTYVLPADFKLCNKLELVIGGTVGSTSEVRQTLGWVTLMQLEQIWQSTGQPVAYNIRRNLLTLRPIPDNTYTVYLSQSYACVDMVTDNDLPDIPEDYTEYVAVLAALDCYMKDQRDPSAFLLAKQKQYEAMLEKDAADRDVSQPRSIVTTELDGWGMLF